MEALLQKIEPRWRPTCSAIINGETATFAQAFQDWWLYHNLLDTEERAVARNIISQVEAGLELNPELCYFSSSTIE